MLYDSDFPTLCFLRMSSGPEVVPIDMIVAVDAEGGIGLEGGLPCQLPTDWKHFIKLTTSYLNEAPWFLFGERDYSAIFINVLPSIYGKRK